MLETNVMTLTHSGTFFRGEPGVKNVRIQTIHVLENKGLVKDISDPAWRWRGSEYEITDKGREAVGLNMSSMARRVGRDTE